MFFGESCSIKIIILIEIKTLKLLYMLTIMFLRIKSRDLSLHYIANRKKANRFDNGTLKIARRGLDHLERAEMISYIAIVVTLL